MKEKILTNVRIIDPSQKMDEIGTIIVNEKAPFFFALIMTSFIFSRASLCFRP